MADNYRNYTELAILFKNKNGNGHSGPGTVALNAIVGPNTQFLLSDHPRIAGALQLSVVHEKERRNSER